MTNNRAKALLEILKSKSNEVERIRAIELHDANTREDEIRTYWECKEHKMLKNSCEICVRRRERRAVDKAMVGIIEYLVNNTQSTDGIMIDKKDGVKEAWIRIFQSVCVELEKEAKP